MNNRLSTIIDLYVGRSLCVCVHVCVRVHVFYDLEEKISNIIIAYNLGSSGLP